MCRCLRGDRRLSCVWYRNDIDLTTNQIVNEFCYVFETTRRIAVFDCDIPAFGVSVFSQALTKAVEIFGSVASRSAAKVPDNGHPGPVRPGSAVSALVNNGHWGQLKGCPLYPRKRTLLIPIGMSALCQKQTLASWIAR